MKKIENIDLAFPCQQDWHKMKIDGQERVCEKCSTCVYDFTNTKTDELTRILENSPGLVCGKFKKSQLSEIFLKYAATTFIATVALTTPVLGQEQIKIDSISQSSEEVEEDIFIGTIVEKQPVPKSGFEGFYEKIKKELKYPEQLADGGKVFIQFTVDTTGNIVDVGIIKGLNEIANEEALRAFLAVNEKFEPGEQRGKAIRVKLVIPIIFDPESMKKKK